MTLRMITLGLLFAGTAQAQQASCDRACLTGFVNLVFEKATSEKKFVAMCVDVAFGGFFFLF